jgi:hypothetical protein
MKTQTFFLTIALAASALAGPLNESDRERVLSELQTSRKMFLDSIANLSPAHWTYKAGPDRWSIAEVSEHIVAAEGFIGGMVTKKIMSAPADAAKAAERQPMNTKSDEAILTMMRDRAHKATAPGEITPKGIYKTPGEAADAFKAARDKTFEYVRTTNDPLREHFFEAFPGRTLDGVQGLLMLAGHTERHVAQIEEVKQSPGYPRP